ncbi:DUF1080 domain-containing protein [soil metagenome]
MYKYCFAALAVVFFFAACQTAKPVISEEEWVPLFNSKDLTGWDIKIAGHDLNDNFNNTFYVKDSMLVVDYSGSDKFIKEFGHVYYNQPFSYYKIRVQYQFWGKQLTGGPGYAYLNSGVMLHSQSAASVGKEQTFPVSLELQLLANDSVTKVHTGNLCTPGTLVSINGKPDNAHCIDSNSPYYDKDAWVTAEADVYGDSVIYHIINGDTVLTYEKPVVAGDFVNSDFNFTSGGFGVDSAQWIQKKGMPLTSGYIALQAESHPIRFKNVELLNLEGCMDPKATNYKSYYIKADNAKCIYK